MNGDARLHSRTAWRRALTVFSFAAGGIAVGIAVVAFTVASPARGVVLEVETATLVTLPVSIPTPTPSTADAPAATQSPDPLPSADPPPATTSTTLPPPKVPATALTINDLDISQEVQPVGLQDDGWMEIPEVTEIGWYRHGAAPGQPGSTVLVAHVWWGDTPGPFYRLGALEPGALIEVGGEDGAVHSYVVVERAMYDKDSLPDRLWLKSGPETLALITCGGEFDRATRRYKENIVIYAVPIVEATDSLPSI
jgi:hypothetical protein